jgi:hypothetical protein
MAKEGAQDYISTAGYKELPVLFEELKAQELLDNVNIRDMVTQSTKRLLEFNGVDGERLDSFITALQNRNIRLRDFPRFDELKVNKVAEELEQIFEKDGFEGTTGVFDTALRVQGGENKVDNDYLIGMGTAMYRIPLEFVSEFFDSTERDTYFAVRLSTHLLAVHAPMYVTGERLTSEAKDEIKKIKWRVDGDFGLIKK